MTERKLLLALAIIPALLVACDGDGSEPGPRDDYQRVSLCRDICQSHAPKQRMCTERCVERGWEQRQERGW